MRKWEYVKGAGEGYSLEFDFIEDGGIVGVRILGEYSITEEIPWLPQLRKKLSEKNARKVLVDFSRCELKTKVVDEYHRPDALLRDNILPSIKFAGVHKKITADIRFMEDVYSNRGYTMRAFTDIDEALEWLRQ